MAVNASKSSTASKGRSIDLSLNLDPFTQQAPGQPELSGDFVSKQNKTQKSPNKEKQEQMAGRKCDRPEVDPQTYW